MLFTSRPAPLQIDSVAVPGMRGRIGLLHCPGMKLRWADFEWDRDLEVDLDALVAWGATALVTLIEQHEFARLSVSDLGRQVQARMQWHCIPIADGGIPDSAAVTAWIKVGSDLQARLRSGRNVALHCHAGLGRTGTMTARLLMDLGMPPVMAIEAVRRARPGAIQTDEQERFLLKA